jgi:hypothetical protein
MVIKNIIITILISNSFSNCHTKNIAKPCPSKQSTIVKDIKLQSSNTQFTIEKVNIFLMDSLKGIQEGDNARLDSLSFENYFNDLIIDKDSNKFLCILYIDTAINNITTISKQNIKAIGCYYNRGDHLLFKLYQKKEDGYVELKEISCKTYLVTANSVSLIQKDIVFLNKGNNSILYITKTSSADYSTIKGKELLYEKVEAYIETLK